MNTQQKLKAEFPNIAITTEWRDDHDYEWDGDGPDPQEEGYLPFNVTVTASRIEAGVLIQRHAYLGGCYAQPGNFDPEINGYFEGLAREAIEAFYDVPCGDFALSTSINLSAPFEGWKFDFSNGCLHHPGEYFTNWFHEDACGQWVPLELAAWVPNASALIAAINTLKP